MTTVFTLLHILHNKFISGKSAVACAPVAVAMRQARESSLDRFLNATTIMVWSTAHYNNIIIIFQCIIIIIL